MQLSVTLSLAGFLLCCTGSVRQFSERLSVPVGNIAALFLLLAACSGTDFYPAAFLMLQLSSALMIGISLFLCRNLRGITLTVLLAFLCGIVSWFLLRVVPSFSEPALVLALPAVLLSLLLPGSDRLKLLCISIAPFFYGLVVTLEEWYLFDAVRLYFGSAQQLNAQLCGAFLLGMLLCFSGRKLKKSFDTQKEY